MYRRNWPSATYTAANKKRRMCGAGCAAACCSVRYTATGTVTFSAIGYSFSNHAGKADIVLSIAPFWQNNNAPIKSVDSIVVGNPINEPLAS
jgi:hypothetical protein